MVDIGIGRRARNIATRSHAANGERTDTVGTTYAEEIVVRSCGRVSVTEYHAGSHSRGDTCTGGKAEFFSELSQKTDILCKRHVEKFLVFLVERFTESGVNTGSDVSAFFHFKDESTRIACLARTGISESVSHGRNELVAHTYVECLVDVHDRVESGGCTQQFVVIQAERDEFVFDCRTRLVSIGRPCAQRHHAEIVGPVHPCSIQYKRGARFGASGELTCPGKYQSGIVQRQ